MSNTKYQNLLSSVVTAVTNGVLNRYYRLNETSGTAAVNYGSDTATGTYHLTPVPTTGLLIDSGDTDQAQSFNGSQYVTTAPVSTSNGFTVSGWIKPTNGTSSGYGQIIGNMVIVNPFSGWSIAQGTGSFGGANSLIVNYGQGGSSYSNMLIGGALSTTSDTFFALTVNSAGTTWTAYINGAQTNQSTGVSNYTPNTSGNLYLGATPGVFGGFVGSVQALEVNSGVMSAAQINELYQMGMNNLNPPTTPTVAITTAGGTDTISASNVSAGTASVAGAYLDTSTNQRSWTLAVSTATGAGPTFSFTNATATAGSQIFYRVRAYDAGSPAQISNPSNVVGSATSSQSNTGGTFNFPITAYFGAGAAGQPTAVSVVLTDHASGAALTPPSAATVVEAIEPGGSTAGRYLVTIPMYKNWGLVGITVNGPSGTTPYTGSTSVVAQ